jgi:hypothetical protein
MEEVTLQKIGTPTIIKLLQHYIYSIEADVRRISISLILT